MKFPINIQNRWRWGVLFFPLIIIVQVFVLTNMDYLVYPEIFIYPYLTKIGLIPYKEIIDQHFPGLFFLPVNFSTLGMTSIDKVRVFHYLLLVLDQIMIFTLVARYTKKTYAALVASSIYAAFYVVFDGHVFWIENILTTLFLANIYFIYCFEKSKNSIYLIIAGVMMGAASLMKQTSVILIFISLLYLFTKKCSYKDILRYLVGPIISIAYLLYFLIDRKIINEFYQWTIDFNLKHYSGLANKLPGVKQVLVVSALVISSIFVLVKKRKDYFVIYLTIFALVTLTYAYPRFEMFHLKPTIGLVSIILGIYSREKLGAIIPVCIMLFGVTLSVGVYQGQTGKVYHQTKEDISIQNKITELTEPGDVVLSFASTPHINFLTNTRPPGNYYVVQLPWYMTLIEGEFLESIKSDKPKVILKSKISTLDGVDTYSYMPSVIEYINEKYVTLDETPNNFILGLR